MERGFLPLQIQSVKKSASKSQLSAQTFAVFKKKLRQLQIWDAKLVVTYPNSGNQAIFGVDSLPCPKEVYLNLGDKSVDL